MIKVKAILKRTGEEFNIDIIRTSKAMSGSITINVKDLEMKPSFVRYEEDGRLKVWNADGTPKYIRIETFHEFNKYWDVIWVDVESFDKLKSNKERYNMIYGSFKRIIRNQKLIELGI
jgi:C-terminal processing protease CtpA/Prc